MHDNRLNTMVRFAAFLSISAGIVAGAWIDDRFLGTHAKRFLVLVILFFVLWVSKKIETTPTLEKESKKRAVCRYRGRLLLRRMDLRPFLRNR